jgi:hypothetical protein
LLQRFMKELARPELYGFWGVHAITSSSHELIPN